MKLTIASGIAFLVGVAVLARADDRTGHSAHGSAFDSGLRQRPWKMEGIGRTHFPITTRVAEAQEWYDQGNTLLHSFWFEEAERSFRWCLKLDPDCTMAYFGLAMTGLNWFAAPDLAEPENKRGLEFLKEASKRKDKVSARERAYIEAWEDAFTGPSKERFEVLAKRLQRIVLAYPDDIEAKALYALYNIDEQHAYETELVIREVLAKEPDHPGAHHYRIHDWDVDGDLAFQALESCRRYGIVAPNIGHSNHMPGHNYTKLGMWREAAISMDSATRVELKYMQDRLALPFETWNFTHNRNYLCYIQEQLGMEKASLLGSRSLLATPRDPDRNKDDHQGAYDQGLQALVRCLVKFERWDEILREGAIPWRDTPTDRANRAFAESLALIANGRFAEAHERVEAMRAATAGQSAGDKEMNIDLTIARPAAEGLLRAAEGDLLDATRLLLEAAGCEDQKRKEETYRNDPPPYPFVIYRVLGDVYLANGENKLAADAYERSLKSERNDAFALAGLTRARCALGDHDAAMLAAGRFAYEWSGADSDLKWSEAVKSLDLDAAPLAQTPAPEREYRPDRLAALGPLEWEPFAAPPLECLDVDGKPVRLEDYRGKNVLLVFYLGEECVHCVEQLVAINARASDFAAADTVILAVSSASHEKNRSSQKLGDLAIHLLSDKDHAAARRFTSYDDFEEIELHSTILIDAQGRVHWKRTGGDPFKDVDFLLRELGRMKA